VNNYIFEHLLIPFIVQFFLVFSLIGVAVGVGLIGWNTATIRFFGTMNRWISTRRWFKPLEVPHDTSGTLQKYRRWIGIFFIIGAAYSIFGLMAWFNASAIMSGFRLDPSPFIVWLIESLRWFLVVASVFAGAIGILLGFFPNALRAFEARANRWYSSRQLLSAGDEMHLPLDKWVEAHSRTAGWIIAVAASAVVACSGIMLFGLK
jgi:hypothetical protein